ncbi:hypothetical protein ACFIOY_15855 [Bradyrhizobium sp. TZ2]
MNTYRVSFYKDLCNSDGHSFKCLQRRVDVQSDDPSQARVLAERLVDNQRLNASCVEVMPLAEGLPEFEHPLGHVPAPSRQNVESYRAMN